MHHLKKNKNGKPLSVGIYTGMGFLGGVGFCPSTAYQSEEGYVLVMISSCCFSSVSAIVVVELYEVVEVANVKQHMGMGVLS